MQRELELVDRPIDAGAVRRQPTTTDAMRLSMQVSVRGEKAIKSDLGIDPGQWTRIFSGLAHFPHNKLLHFMDATDNNVLLEWLAYHRGFRLVLLEDEKDRQIRELQSQLDRERLEREAIQKFLRETKT